MTPDVVVDVGNSRIKWGRVADGRVAEAAAFGHDEPVAWKRQAELWGLHDASRWVLAGVVPVVVERFCHWLAARGESACILTNDRFDPDLTPGSGFRTGVREPGRVGIDRLLTAFAAWRRAGGGTSAVALNVGTAMTLDFVERDGLHRGGAILPGPRLMARSLSQHTAKLPEVDIRPRVPTEAWGEDTEGAIELGIANAVLGVADQMVWDWAAARPTPPAVFVTGGDGGYFDGYVFTADVAGVTLDPHLTLDGIRLAAEECL